MEDKTIDVADNAIDVAAKAIDIAVNENHTAAPTNRTAGKENRSSGRINASPSAETFHAAQGKSSLFIFFGQYAKRHIGKELMYRFGFVEVL